MKYKEIREQMAAKYMTNTTDCGRKGRAFELAVALDKSRKTRVSKQGQIDVYIKIRRDNGKVTYAPAEAKTNGGRIEELLFGSKAQYIIYSMIDVPVPQGKKAREEGRPVQYRNIKPVVIPKDLFLAKLKEFNAIKTINRSGELDGYGIQVTNKPWYEWLSAYPTTWEQGYTYEPWEFEGIE